MLNIKLTYDTIRSTYTATKTGISACCVINPKYKKLFTPEIERYINNYYEYSPNTSKIIDGNTIVICCLGESDCMPEDTFDMYIGGKISQSKAKIKIYRFMKNLCKKIITEFMPLITGTDILTTIKYDKNSIIDDYIKYEALETNERFYLKKLIKK